MSTTTASDADRLIAEFHTLYEWASDLANSVRYGSKIIHKLGKIQHDVDVAYRLLEHLHEAQAPLPWDAALEQVGLMLAKVDRAIDKTRAELAELNSLA